MVGRSRLLPRPVWRRRRPFRPEAAQVLPSLGGVRHRRAPAMSRRAAAVVVLACCFVASTAWPSWLRLPRREKRDRKVSRVLENFQRGEYYGALNVSPKASPQQLKKACAPPGSAAPRPRRQSNFFVFKDKVLFSADDGKHGAELWITDGTETGTKLLKDIATGTFEDFMGDQQPNGSGPVRLHARRALQHPLHARGAPTTRCPLVVSQTRFIELRKTA